MVSQDFTSSDRIRSLLPTPVMSDNIPFRPIRFVQTVRHLKASQVFYRLWYKYQRPVPTENLNYSRTPCLIKPEFISKPESCTDGLIFSFIGHQVSFPEQVDWTCKDQEPLWALNLHYFDFVNSENANLNKSQALIKHWIENNSVYSKPGWASYPTSLRIVNWIKFDLKNNLFSKHELDSLFVQCRFLSQRIEYDILANHLTANFKALIFAGSFFSGSEPTEWLKKGLNLLEHELEEQINADGAHFELSPMYHAILLEDLIDIHLLLSAFGYLTSTLVTDQEDSGSNHVNQGESSSTIKSFDFYRLTHELERNIQRMLLFLETVTHPDGEPSFFNDSAMDIAPNYYQLKKYASNAYVLNDLVSSNSQLSKNQSHLKTLKESIAASTNKSTSVKTSGYRKSCLGNFTLITNVTPISPSYQPSHAHADTLSFELSFKKQRILVNSGTSTYSKGNLRHRQRSTRAHNALEIDNTNSSDVWASFRVGKRARILEYLTLESDKKICISGSHDGYRSWTGGTIHKREWTLEKDRLSCLDNLQGKYKKANLFFHFHPDMALVSKNVLATPDGVQFKWTSSETKLEWLEGYWYPRFGEKQKNLCLQIEVESENSGSKISNQLCLISETS